MLRTILVTLALTLSAVPVAAGTMDDAAAAYHRGDYKTVVRLLRPLAEQGDAGAQSRLGVMYQTGQGVPQDYAEAAGWFRKAAEHGVAMAQSELGVMYFNGWGVPRDDVLAYMWLNLAAAQGALGLPESYEANSRRDHVAKFMTREQIAEAQRMAREWRPK